MSTHRTGVGGLLAGIILLVLTGPATAQIYFYPAPGRLYPSMLYWRSYYGNYPGYDPVSRSESLRRQILYYEQQARDVGDQLSGVQKDLAAAQGRLESAQQDAEAARQEIASLRQQSEQLRRQQFATTSEAAAMVQRVAATAAAEDPRMQALVTAEADAQLALAEVEAEVLGAVRQEPDSRQAYAALQRERAQLAQLRDAGRAGTPEIFAAATALLQSESGLRAREQAALDADARYLNAVAAWRDAGRRLKAARSRAETAARGSIVVQALDKSLSDGRTAIAATYRQLAEATKRQSVAEATIATAGANVERLQASGRQLSERKQLFDDRRAVRVIELQNLQYVFGGGGYLRQTVSD